MLKVLITGRNEVVAKVMFLHVCCDSVHRGGSLGRENPPGQGEPPPGQGEPPLDRENPPTPTPQSRLPRDQTSPHPPTRNPPGTRTHPLRKQTAAYGQ